MKKKIVIFIVVMAILVLLFAPFYTASYDDGGTRVYGALTYKIVVWKKIYSVQGTYQNTSVFWYPDNQKSIDELWEIEKDNHLGGEELAVPTPTLAPGQNQALPTTMIDGDIYFMNGMYSTTNPSEIERLKELMEQAEYLGTITKNTPASAYPTEELDSNCSKEGSRIYRHIVEEKVNFIIVTPNEVTYHYVSGWTKYRWFEGALVDAGKQEYNTYGMPTPTPAL